VRDPRRRLKLELANVERGVCIEQLQQMRCLALSLDGTVSALFIVGRHVAVQLSNDARPCGARCCCLLAPQQLLLLP
jgi:hypothetical protein